MTKLRISPDLSLPESTATSTILVLGGKGMGKTNLDAVIAEECSACRIRFSWLDPIGVAWSLQHGATKTEPGLEVLVLGGIHGDIPIEPLAGAIVADLVVDHDVSVVIDISRRPDGRMWSHGEQIRFVTDYMVRLYERQGEKRRPLLQIFDEIGRFAPQEIRSGAVDIQKCLGAIEQVVELGRNVGIGMLMSTQRNAKIAAAIRELADAMFAFRTVGPLSLKAIQGWLGEHVDKERARAIEEEIRKLPVGHAMLVSPGWLQLERVVPVRKRTTFDASATPTGGTGRAPGKARKPDLAKYRELMAATIEKAVADDPGELRKKLLARDKRIKELELAAERDRAAGAAAIAKAEAATKVQTKQVDVPVLKDAQVAGLLKAIHRVAGIVNHLGDIASPIASALSAVSSSASERGSYEAAHPAVTGHHDGTAVRAGTSGPQTASRAAEGQHRSSLTDRSRTGVVTTAQALGRGLRDAETTPARTTGGGSSVAQLEERGRSTTEAAGSNPAPRSTVPAYTLKVLDAIATIASITGERNPSHIRVGAFAGLSSTGGTYKDYVRTLTRAGLTEHDGSGAALTDAGRAAALPLPITSEEDLRKVARSIVPSYTHKILEALIAVYPTALDLEDLGLRVGMAASGGTFKDYMRTLRRVGFIEFDRSAARATSVLFLEAA